MRFPILAVFAIAAAPAPALAQSDPAVAPVQALDNGLLSIMKSRGGTAARAAAIGPVVDRSFDLALMTRLSVGAGWTTMAPADQQALVTAFRRLTVSSYASNFSGWSGQSFAIAPQVETRGGDKLVRTTLNNPKGGPVSISYRLRQSGGGWRIIDVFYKNSISQLATRRSDFASVLQSGGAKALVAHLNSLAAKAGG
jgi:phospholipid transport system substrate-binding protein